jgi:Fic family protein
LILLNFSIIIGVERNIMYIHQRPNWPIFQWNHEHVANLLVPLRHRQGILIGAMHSIGFKFEQEIILQALTQDVVKSSEIEGEILDASSARSSVARHLGIDGGAANSTDRNVDGVVEMILDATQNYDQPLTKERLFNWHGALFPTGRSGFSKIQVAAWRRGSIQVVSGRKNKEIVHFEGPSADRVEEEMNQFTSWCNAETAIDPVLKAALAHFWFVTIHPFDDGNGRIARALADLMLARSEKSPNRFYSLSAQIQIERKSYYDILERTQKGGLDVTPWIEWFFACLAKAIEKTMITFELLAQKRKYLEALTETPLNERQQKIIHLLLDGFEGKLTTSKWAKIAKCSQDTAYRDILDLVNRGLLIKHFEGGRSTSYGLGCV